MYYRYVMFVLVVIIMLWISMHMLLMGQDDSKNGRLSSKTNRRKYDAQYISNLIMKTKQQLNNANAHFEETHSESIIIPIEKKETEKEDLIATVNLRSEHTPSDTNDMQLHTVTYASHHGKDDRFCRAVESAIRHHYDLVILGWKVPWKGLSQKLEAAYEFSLQIPENDIMLFTDAFDVLYTEESAKIIKIFQERKYSIVFSAECGCWPHIMDDPPACFKKYPTAPTPYRYLNSGAWMGIVKYVRPMLKEIIRLAGNDFQNANDQKLVADMFISGQFPIALDYHSEIFQSMHSTDPPDLPRCKPREDLQLDMTERKWHNTRTNTVPAIFHFNGGGKVNHLDMEGKIWYKEGNYYEGEKRQALADYKIQIPVDDEKNRLISYNDMCGDYLNSGSH